MRDFNENPESLQAQVHALRAELQSWRRRQVAVVAAAALLVGGWAVAQPTLIPFVQDTPASALEVNANFNQLAAWAVPKGAILFIDAATCPPGYTQTAQGYSLVGRPSNGTNGLAFGFPMGGNTPPSHTHTMTAAGAHSHGGVTGGFAGYVAGEVNWATVQGSANQFHHRHAIGTDGEHTHTATSTSLEAVLPYIYYTACKKN